MMEAGSALKSQGVALTLSFALGLPGCTRADAQLVGLQTRPSREASVERYAELPTPYARFYLSPQRDRLAFVTAGGQLALFTVATRQVEPIHACQDLRYDAYDRRFESELQGTRKVLWSPDGQHLLLFDAPHLYVITPAQQKEVPIADVGPWSMPEYAWRDASTVLFCHLEREWDPSVPPRLQPVPPTRCGAYEVVGGQAQPASEQDLKAVPPDERWRSGSSWASTDEHLSNVRREQYHPGEPVVQRAGGTVMRRWPGVLYSVEIFDSDRANPRDFMGTPQYRKINVALRDVQRDRAQVLWTLDRDGGYVLEERRGGFQAFWSPDRRNFHFLVEEHPAGPAAQDVRYALWTVALKPGVQALREQPGPEPPPVAVVGAGAALPLTPQQDGAGELVPGDEERAAIQLLLRNRKGRADGDERGQQP